MKQENTKQLDNENVEMDSDSIDTETAVNDATEVIDLEEEILNTEDAANEESENESQSSDETCEQKASDDSQEETEYKDQPENEDETDLNTDCSDNVDQIEASDSAFSDDSDIEAQEEKQHQEETEGDPNDSDEITEPEHSGSGKEKKTGRGKRLLMILLPVAALLCLAALTVFVIIPSALYASGKKALANYEFDKAQDTFIRLKTYRDSEELVKECDYQKANAYTLNGDFENAILLWEELDGYKDSGDKIADAETAIRDRAAAAVMDVDETIAKHDIKSVEAVLKEYTIDSETQTDRMSIILTGSTDTFRYDAEYDLVFAKNEEGIWILQENKRLSDAFEPLVSSVEAAKKYLEKTYPDDDFELVEDECWSEDSIETQVFMCVKREHLTYQTQYSVEVKCMFDEAKGDWKIISDEWLNVLDIDDEKKTYEFYGFDVVVPEWWTADVRVVGAWTPINDLPDDDPEADFYADGKLVLSLHPTLLNTYSDSAFNDLLNRLQPDGVTLRPYTIYKDAGRIVFCPYGFDSFETIETYGLTTEEVKYIAEHLH